MSYSTYLFSWKIPAFLCNDPFRTPGGLVQPAGRAHHLGRVTAILVIGIRESATTNAVLVGVKLGVVLFVIGVGVFFINPANWTNIPPTDRIYPEDLTTIPSWRRNRPRRRRNSGAERVQQ